MLNKENPEHQIAVLHRYFIWTTLMKKKFEEELRNNGWLPKKEESVLLLPYKMMSHPVGTYMAYWYGGLFVVCEGWQELNLEDQTIDNLPNNSNLGLLKRFRNGIFHFQKDYFDSRFIDFQQSTDSAKWIRELSEAIGSWFLAHIKKTKPIDHSQTYCNFPISADLPLSNHMLH